MNISTLNWLAIFLATLSTFLIGGIWYSVLFAKQWMAENSFSEEDLKKRNMPKVFALTFLYSFIMSFNMAMFLNDAKTTTGWGMIAGFLAGFGWVTMFIFIIGLFEKRSTKYMLIHAGYVTISLVVMGLILGSWR